MVAAGWTAPQSNHGKTEDDDPDMRAIRDYRLSLKNIKEFADASKALLANPATQKCLNDNPPGNANSIDAGAKIIDGCPGTAAIVKQNGLSTHDYTLMISALMGDWGAVTLKRAGTIKEYPSNVSPENAAFLEQNYDKVKATLDPIMLTGNDKGDSK
jgi:hypothetical protein